jgi:superfamily II DNA or RNA helicase
MTRDERQDLCIDRWKQFNGKATILACTAFGKTRIALKTISRLLIKKPDYKILVVVPTTYLLSQWVLQVNNWGFNDSVTVLVINTVIKSDHIYDMMICDEVHLAVADMMIQAFERVKYKLLMCLTGTIDRLDGKQERLFKYAPICDTVTLEEAIENKWVADYQQYKVFLDVDLTTYNAENTKFLHYFSYFGFDFEAAMACATDWEFRALWSREHGMENKDVLVQGMGFLRAMKARKSFIYDHPKKIEIANLIINARQDKKIITFTKHVEHAKLICCGDIYHGKVTKKKKEKMMADFNLATSGVLNSCKALDVGADIHGVHTAIILSGDSSSITKSQKVGRALRRNQDVIAELWQLIIRGTVEEEWYRKSSGKLKVKTINEEQLKHFLETGIISDKIHKEKQFLFRF